MKSRLELVCTFALAVMMLTFGLNKFLHFIVVDPPSDPIAQQFMGAMFSTYLFKVVAVFQIIAGILLLIKPFRFVGWLILSPIIFNIVAFHIAHDFIGNGIWLLPTIIFGIVGYFHLPRISSLFKI